MPKLAARLAIALFLLPIAAAQGAACTGHGVELQVLGSGGPELLTDRASSSYLIRRDGRASVLIDSGGGSALRFGAAGAKVVDLDLVLFTHLHADHSADFPALVKSSYFQERQRPLPVFGPPGNTMFPSTTQFLRSLFDRKSGAFRYLADYLPPDGKAGPGAYALQPHDVRLAASEIKAVFSADGLNVSATPLIHGGVPALGWRIETDGASLVFSGDTNGDNGNLERLAKNADLFVAHNAVPEAASGPPRALHMPPSVIGRVAGAAAVKALVLSHRMSRTLGREAETQAEIEKKYTGPLSFADDLDCYAVGASR